MLRQNQIGTKAMMNIAIRPSPNRSICGSAQGVHDPPATEYSIRNPALAVLISNRVSGQFMYRNFRNPEGVDFTAYSR